MSDRTVMVDLDDTLIDFTNMFLQRAKKLFYESHRDYIVSNNLSYDVSSNWLTRDDIFNYDYRIVFEQYYEKQFGFDKETGRKDCEAFLNACFDDITFYNYVLLTPEFYKVLDYIKVKQDEGYKIILNTKLNSLTMVKSKTNMLESLKLDKCFDEIIFDVECRIGHSEKPHHYDIMIDDSPKNITNYLNKNEKGIVMMPLREWNKHLLNDLSYKTRITII